MKNNNNFCAFILTNGRPDRVYTYSTLIRSGYTGKIFIVIDDEDKTGPEYIKKFGENVLIFSKKEIAKTFDEGDNFNERRAIIYARNACWDLAKKVGCKHFIQLDDDYTNFKIRFRADGTVVSSVMRNLDKVIEAMLEFLIATPTISVAMSQGGDHIGGPKRLCLKRKAMNSFICSTDRPFKFFGKVNEDVNTYTNRSRCGDIFFTVFQIMLTQKATQSNAGGMTELYLDSGTYVKTFYSIMYSPSCVKIGTMGDPVSGKYRIHHEINWNNTAPKILSEEWAK